jgi:hypothetical protein
LNFVQVWTTIVPTESKGRLMRTLPVGAAFGHSINSTVNNLKFAFHVSWPWLIVLLPVSVFSNVYFQLHPVEPNTMPDAQTVVLGLLSAVLEIAVFASIAVSWHRYILKDEVPQSIGDRLRADSVVLRYAGNTVLVWLRVMAMMMLSLLPFLIVVGALAVSKVLGSLVGILWFIGFLAYAVWLIGAAGRWSIKLVSVAVGKDMPMRDAWSATEGSHWQIVGLYCLFALCALGVGLVLGGIAFAGASSGSIPVLIVVMAVQTMINWVFTIWGVTLLTSLYGFFVENREF